MLIFARENYSNGSIEGTITNFKRQGMWWKTWEGHLNVTQTGMNSSTGFDFSVDRDNEPAALVNRLDSASKFGWKVELVYHEVRGWNWLQNRGHENTFVTDCIVKDRNFSNGLVNRINGVSSSTSTAQAVQMPAQVLNGLKNRDTIYVYVLNMPQPKE